MSSSGEGSYPPLCRRTDEGLIPRSYQEVALGFVLRAVGTPWSRLTHNFFDQRTREMFVSPILGLSARFELHGLDGRSS
jgi:hypothetical protein